MMAEDSKSSDLEEIVSSNPPAKSSTNSTAPQSSANSTSPQTNSIEPQHQPQPTEQEVKAHFFSVNEQKGSCIIRSISDVQDFGGAAENLAVYKALLAKASSELGGQDRLALLGDIFYDTHVAKSLYYSQKALDKSNMSILSEQAKRHLLSLPENKRTGQTRLHLIAEYVKEAATATATLEQKLKVGRVDGNNDAAYGEVMHAQNPGITRQQLETELRHRLPGDSLHGYIGYVEGVKAFGLEYFQENRNMLQADEGGKPKSLLYTDLKEHKPQLLLLHGHVTYKGAASEFMSDNGQDNLGLNKYIDEYDGSGPLVIMHGHHGKQGIHSGVNSKGKKVYILNSNCMIVKRSDGTEYNRGVTYDLKIVDGQMKGVTAQTYHAKLPMKKAA